MFNLLSEISDKVTYYTGGIYYNGKKALNEYYDTLIRISIPFFIRSNEPYDQNLLDTLSSFWNCDGRNIIHYFQLIRQLLEKFDSDTLIDQALFINLLKSQLSNDELCLFAYYCIWKSDQELYALVNEWDFFIDVRPNSLIEESHQSKFNGAFGCPF